MAGIDLSTRSIPELQELIAQATRRLEELKEQQRRELAREFRDRARALGLTPEELLKPETDGPLYRNPQHPDQTWAGRGRRPKWLNEELDQGKSLEDFRV